MRVGSVDVQGFINDEAAASRLTTTAHHYGREENWVELSGGGRGNGISLFLSVDDALALAAKLRSGATYLDGHEDEADGELVDVVEEIERTQNRLREMDEHLTKLKAELYTGERR